MISQSMMIEPIDDMEKLESLLLHLKQIITDKRLTTIHKGEVV
ncbi:MAG: hypothetical protein P0116_15410 [Candidatus Nitrosocosmicus sp.]|nr:hypothetical protein [Candidatus Nitrosocosmicus sp.]